MAVVYPQSSRVQVHQGDGTLTLTIPARRNWFLLAFLSLWLCGWVVGEFAVLGGLLAGSAGWFALEGGLEAGKSVSLFLVVWLIGWTVGGCFALAVWLYQLKGREIVQRDGPYLRHVRDFRIYRRSQEYLLEHVKNLRMGGSAGNLFDLMSPGRALEFWGIGGGLICFDYGSRTIRMGAGLEEAEAQPLIGLLGSQPYRTLG